jgi:peptidoglycan/LPS O-acetylase OafA/YrhL
MNRLRWLDISKGLAILWVVYFHFFRTYFEHGALPPSDWTSFSGAIVSFLRTAWLEVSGLGFHAVGVFIILSGWALMESTALRADSNNLSWSEWYRSRFLRLYPMYWVAHLVYLISPFLVRPEPVDSRIFLSLLGLRFVDIQMNFYYLNPAWWYFGMLIQFYLLFPLLFSAVRKLGPWTFLLIACAIGFATRYLMLFVYPQNGMWIQGGFAVCRLPEFALGMVLGIWHSRSQQRSERFFLNGVGLAMGIILYPLVLQLYRNGYGYIFVDLATGACCLLAIVGVSGLIVRSSFLTKIFASIGIFSYGLYLVHQPYVIWLGLRIREQPIWMFLIIAFAVMTVLSGLAILLEKLTNTAVNKLSAMIKH